MTKDNQNLLPVDKIQLKRALGFISSELKKGTILTFYNVHTGKALGNDLAYVYSIELQNAAKAYLAYPQPSPEGKDADRRLELAGDRLKDVLYVIKCIMPWLTVTASDAYRVDKETITIQTSQAFDILNVFSFVDNNTLLQSSTVEIPADDALTVADYEECMADHRRLVRELDVLLNGDGAAKQASLCDIVWQLKHEKAPSNQEPPMTDAMPDVIYAVKNFDGENLWCESPQTSRLCPVNAKYLRADTVQEAVNGDLVAALKKIQIGTTMDPEMQLGLSEIHEIIDSALAKIDTGITLLRFVAALEEIRDVIYPDEKGITDFGIQQNLKFLLSHMRMTAQKALQSLSDKD